MIDALTYIKTKARMCNSYSMCSECPLEDCRCTAVDCGDEKEQKRLVEIVEAWNKEHPAKTRQSMLLEIFPDITTFDFEGATILSSCPSNFFDPYKCIGNFMTCDECRKKFWLEEIE